MKKIRTLFASLLIVSMLGACSNNPGHFTPAQVENPNMGILYLYRPAATNPGLMKPLKFDYPDVIIDGKSMGVLKYNEYVVAELPPGEHTVNITGLTTAASGWAERDIERRITISKDAPTFLKLRVAYDLNEMKLGQPGARYIIRLMPVNEEDAKYEIRSTDRAKD